MRIVNCGYCRCKVAEIEAGSKLKPYTLMLCQECAKKVGAIVADQQKAKAGPAPKDLFGMLEEAFGKKAGPR